MSDSTFYELQYDMQCKTPPTLPSRKFADERIDQSGRVARNIIPSELQPHFKEGAVAVAIRIIRLVSTPVGVVEARTVDPLVCVFGAFVVQTKPYSCGSLQKKHTNIKGEDQ